MNRFFRHSKKSATQQPGMPSTFSANWLRRLSGSILLPLGGRLGGGFLLFLLLLVGTNYAHAQNTPTVPFYDSWHLYRITMDNTSNTVSWELFAGNLSGSPVSITSAYFKPRVVGTNAEIEVYIEKTLFETNSTWFVVYNETNSVGNCVARRSIQLNPVVNNFFLSVALYDTTCNSYTGRVWPNDVQIISDVDSLSTLDFTITMNKPASFRTDGWSFSGTLAMILGGANNTIQSSVVVVGTSLRGGVCTVSGTSNNFTLNVAGPDNLDQLTDEVVIRVGVIGDVTSDFEVLLTISNGIALSGNSNYVVKTSDNGSGNKQMRQYIYGIPNTSVVMYSP